MDQASKMQDWSKAFSSMNVGFDSWKKMSEEQITRMESLQQELARLDSANSEKFKAAIDEGAKLLRQSCDYTTKFYSDWREQAMEASRAVATAISS